MAGKTLINGVAYTITGGKTLINGTSYNISKGRTLINGTGYDINFKKAQWEVIYSQDIYWNVIENKTFSTTIPAKCVALVIEVCSASDTNTDIACCWFINGNIAYEYPYTNMRVNGISISGTSLTVTYMSYKNTNYLRVYALCGAGQCNTTTCYVGNSKVVACQLAPYTKFAVAATPYYSIPTAIINNNQNYLGAFGYDAEFTAFSQSHLEFLNSSTAISRWKGYAITRCNTTFDYSRMTSSSIGSTYNPATGVYPLGNPSGANATYTIYYFA